MNRKLTSLLHRATATACLAVAIISSAGCASSSGPTKPTVPSGSYVFWPQFPDDPRMQYLRSISSSDDLAAAGESSFSKMIFGKKQHDSEGINKPYGVAMHDGKLYVCDIRNDCLTVLDLKKRQTRLVGMNGMMTLKRPVAVAVAADGEIYVADNDRGSIFVFDPSEKYSRVMGHPKLKPAGVAVFGDRLYVTDMTSQSVEIYDRKSGDKQASFGTVGDEDGQFRLPLGIAVDTKGDVYVVDMMRCRVQKFSPDGKFLSGFGTLGDYAGAFVRPKHIAVDSDGVIYVVDAAFQNVQMFDREYHFLMHFGSSGAFPGSMNLPAGVCATDDSLDLFAGLVYPGFAPKHLVVVTNQFGDQKVNLYAMGTLREGYTARDAASSAVKIPTGMGEGAKDILQSPVPGSEAAPNPSEGPKPGATPADPKAQPASKPAPKADAAPPKP